MEATAKCRKCGKFAPASRFVLDPIFKMMICPICAKEQEIKGKKEEELKQKLAGWDTEDEYLEKVYKQRKKVNVVFKRLDEERIKYTCHKCAYSFIYNTIKRYPNSCLYCGAKILTFQFQ